MAPNRIRTIRMQKGITIEALAERVGLSLAHVYRLENGDRNLGVKHFAAFAKALSVDPADLIDPVVDGDMELLKALRQADPKKKEAVALLLGIPFDLIDPEQPVSAQGKQPATRR